VRTVPRSSLAGDCPSDWLRSLVWRIVQRGSLCQALTPNILACGAVALPGVVAFTPCCCVLSLILVGLGFIRMLFFFSLSRGMPESVFD